MARKKKNRTTIVLRGDDKRKFEEITEELQKAGIETKAGVIRKLMRFYEMHSPYLGSTKAS